MLLGLPLSDMAAVVGGPDLLVDGLWESESESDWLPVGQWLGGGDGSCETNRRAGKGVFYGAEESVAAGVEYERGERDRGGEWLVRAR